MVAEEKKLMDTKLRKNFYFDIIEESEKLDFEISNPREITFEEQSKQHLICKFLDLLSLKFMFIAKIDKNNFSSESGSIFSKINHQKFLQKLKFL